MIHKEKPKGFVPLFKEQSNEEQFMFKNDEWVRTNETNISGMWFNWGRREDQSKYEDEDKFVVYGYIKKEE
jgi:hypothetical protein